MLCDVPDTEVLRILNLSGTSLRFRVTLEEEGAKGQCGRPEDRQPAAASPSALGVGGDEEHMSPGSRSARQNIPIVVAHSSVGSARLRAFVLFITCETWNKSAAWRAVLPSSQ